jgi:hypothetical protein
MNHNKIRNDAFAAVGMSILLAYAVIRSLFDAASKPFWLDELLTLMVARAPGVSAIWRALARATDGQPPPFYLVERAAGTVLRNPEISYRLPSILGFACSALCVFLFATGRSNRVYGLLCAAMLLLSMAYDPYATEARPYSLLVACMAIALICYQRAPQTGWMVLMGCSFAAAESLHYYAIFALVPFGLAEVALYLQTRQIRPSVWLAMICGVLPLALFWPLVSRLKKSYEATPYTRPTLLRAVTSYGWFFHVPYAQWSHGWELALAATAVLVLAAIVLRFASLNIDRARLKDPLFHEHILIAALLGLPFITWASSKFSGGAMDHRYALATVLAVSLGCGYVLPHLRRSVAVLAAVFIFCLLARQEIQFWREHRGHLGELQSPADSVEELASLTGQTQLPIVVSDAAEYVQIMYYASPDWRNRFIAVVDPTEARAYLGADVMDKALLQMHPFFPLHVYEFRTFAADHSIFLLYSGEGFWDWWPRRLAHDGDELSLLAEKRGQRMYLVKLKPSEPRREP